MAVARQFIAVTGESADGTREIYTTHFAWGTMDKSWRRRLPPPEQSDLSLLALRGDSTIVVPGTLHHGKEAIRGHWSQRVLPANGQETPSVAALAREPKFEPREAHYEHPWRFVAEGPSEVLHQRFSHYGVLEPVDSRIQCYRIEHVEYSAPVTASESEAVRWLDSNRSLQIRHRRLSFANAAAALQGVDAGDAAAVTAGLAGAVQTATHPSIHSEHLAFHVVHRPGLGWLLLHADPREEKLIGFDDIGDTVVVLTEDGPQPRRARIRGLRHVRNARDPHGATVGAEADGVSPPAVSAVDIEVTSSGTSVDSVRIRFTVARRAEDARHPALAAFAEWVAMNIWRIKLGFVPSGSDQPELLLDVEREPNFVPDATGRVHEMIWRPAAADQRGGLLGRILSEEGAIRFGTSVWFVGSTGLAAPPDETTFGAPG